MPKNHSGIEDLTDLQRMQETLEFDKKLKKKGSFREYAEALLTALVVAFFIRSFGVEAFKIPSGSMIPTLMIGDHIFVNKFIYGLRIPFTKKKIIHFRDPKRGEAIVFMYPLDEGKDFIKRVIGLPGDQIKIDGDEVFVNGEKLAREELKVIPNQSSSTRHIAVTPPQSSTLTQIPATDIPAFPDWESYAFLEEKVGDTTHLVQFDDRPNFDVGDLTVPDGHLFVMGDNRDNSSDSREWGFVPLENVKGKAMFIWLSLDYDHWSIRWDRFGKWIH